MRLTVPPVPVLAAPFEIYDRPQQDAMLSGLRLFFTRVINVLSALNDSVGVGYLRSPHGGFSSRVTQSTTANTATRVAFATTDFLNNTSAHAGGGVEVAIAGVYLYQYMLQLESTSATAQEVSVWVRVNGVDVVYAGSKFAVPATHGGVNGYTLATASFYVQLSATDYVDLWWATTSATVTLEAYAAQTVPFAMPGIPSAIATLTFVSALAS